MDLTHDQICQDMIHSSIQDIKDFRRKTKFICILLALLCAFIFSKTDINIFGFSLHYNLGLGWIGLIIAFVLVIFIIIGYNVCLSFHELTVSNRILSLVNEKCDPLRANYVYTQLIKQKVLNEENICMDLISVLQLQNHQERIRDLLNQYPNAGTKNNHRIVAEFELLSEEEKIKRHEEFYQKNIAIIESMQLKNKKADSKSFELVKKSHLAQYLMYQKDYLKAIELLQELASLSPVYQVISALKMGKCYMALNDNERAIKNFEYVINHGNTMYAVIEAKELMKKLEEKKDEC
ncbi:tetratricopeptide repeat protein [Longibaculum muris]|uniref:tetratricopeptide repeat protein n=1 Tax=Longibaculum muris TaxID=1796628 RepID=UPI0022E3CC4D|nr:hypothetical protein [Longibaculum muris]